MITKKEDLHNTYVDGSDKELATAFQELLFSFDVLWLDFEDKEVRLPDGNLTHFCFDGNFISWNSKEFSESNYSKKLTLEDLKPQAKEAGWVNGDACRYTNDIEHEYTYIGEHPHGDGHYAFSEEKGITYIANGYLLEPETEAERKEREEIEAASYLLSDWFNITGKDMPEWSSVNEDVKAHYLRIVRKTNHKVKGE